MIITRSPLRLTFGGGGSDILSYANKHGGFCISAAINKYVYIAINRTFQEGIFLKYSELEKIKTVDEIQHPILKEAIKLLNFKTPQLEITSVADIPAGGGLGGSGSFSVALLKALYLYRHISMTPDQIAELACDININKLNFIQGKQDEYISALGGIICLEFEKNGNVTHYPLKISHDTLVDLEENLLLFYTGINHNTTENFKNQDKKLKLNDNDMISSFYEIKELGYKSKEALENGNLKDFALLMNEQWENKRKRTIDSSNTFIEDVYYNALKNGALGMKLIGSGNGGFFMGYSTNKNELRSYMKTRGLEELRFNFDFDGVKQIL
jgi:D-glycero-alpha-D-manno-heptose-7-phosphate kinase